MCWPCDVIWAQPAVGCFFVPGPVCSPRMLSTLMLVHGVCAGDVSAILVASDAEAAEQTARQLRGSKYGLVWTQLNELSSFYYDR